MTTHIGKITDEAMAKVRSMIGVELRPMQPFADEASRDTIRRWAWGIGDGNPLWYNEEYAKKTKWGGIIAPPSFLFAAHSDIGVGLPGVHALWAGDDWEWWRTIFLGDRFTTKTRLINVVERPGKYAGRFIQQDAETVWYNQRQEKVGRVIHTLFRMEIRGSGGTREKYADVTRAKYTPEDYKKLDADIMAEQIRGAEPRYWEDVNIGDVMVPVVKGPLTEQDMIAHYCGYGATAGAVGGLELYSRYRMRHPTWGYVNPETGIIEAPARVHSQDWMARDVGAPGAYDNGSNRISWFAHLVTNWMGDDAFLRRLRVELRRFNVLGDTQWMKGKVVNKHIVDGEYRAELDMEAVNQKGETNAFGWATVILPSKETGPAKLPIRDECPASGYPKPMLYL